MKLPVINKKAMQKPQSTFVLLWALCAECFLENDAKKELFCQNLYNFHCFQTKLTHIFAHKNCAAKEIRCQLTTKELNEKIQCVTKSRNIFI